MIQISKVVSIALLFCSAIGQEPFQGVIYAPDPMVHWNDGYYVSAYFSKPFWGIGDGFHSAYLGFLTPQFVFGSVGLSLEHVGVKYYNEQRFELLLKSPRINAGDVGIFIWGAPGIQRAAYNKADFHRFDESDGLFDDRSQKIAPFIDGGISGISKLGIISLWLTNILKPNLTMSDDPNGAKPLGFEGYIAGAVGYDVFPWLGLLYDGTSGRILPLAGATYRYLGWTFSLGYRSSGIWLDIAAPVINQRLWSDYSVGYHVATGELARSVMTSHTFGIKAVFPRIIKPTFVELPNLTVEPGELTDVWSLDTIRVSVAARNKSKIISDTTTLSLFIESEGEPIPIGVAQIPPLMPGQDHLAKFKWLPPHLGTFKLVFTVDDDGSHYPGIFGRIAESSEEDNRLEHDVLVFGDLRATISPLVQVLSIPNITYLREEQPIVPLIFFKPGSDEVNPKYDTLLSVISERLQMNPDVLLELAGYVDTETDGNVPELAIRRAEMVRDRLIVLGTPPSSIAIKRLDEYNAVKKRIPTDRTGIPLRERQMIQEENRRVEMIARFPDLPFLVYEFPIEANAKELPRENLRVLDTLADKLAGILCSDHNATILIEGVNPKGSDPIGYLKSLDLIRKYLLPRLQVFCPLERIPISVVGEGEKGLARIWLSAEAIIFKPIENAEAAKEFVIPEDVGKNLIVIEVANPEMVKDYDIYVFKEKTGEIIRRFAKGDGPPPSQVVWDWRDENGNLIDPRGKYRIMLVLVDQFDQVYRVQSDAVFVKVEEFEHRVESSIIVQFSFDETTSESKYLESRLEEFARQIVEKANIPGNSVNVKFTGHTDIIGTPTRNQQLSDERAQKELNKTRKLLCFILGLDNESELRTWLSNNNVSMSAVGVRDTEPYEIERYRNGKFEKVLVGDDNTPEGRSLNRRVVVEFDERIVK